MIRLAWWLSRKLDRYIMRRSLAAWALDKDRRRACDEYCDSCGVLCGKCGRPM